jgi:hypothetical protein
MPQSKHAKIYRGGVTAPSISSASLNAETDHVSDHRPA